MHCRAHPCQLLGTAGHGAATDLGLLTAEGMGLLALAPARWDLKDRIVKNACIL